MDEDRREYPRDLFWAGTDPLVLTRSPRSDADVPAIYPCGVLRQRLALEPTNEVAALIFHCSRCGSTLLHRLFELNAATRAFAEPKALLKYFTGRGRQLLRGEAGDLDTLVRAYGLSPQSGERRVVIKLNSHALVYLPLFRAAFPNAHFIYLLRKPIEIITSLQRLPPTFLRDEERPAVAMSLGTSAADVAHLHGVEWFAWYVRQNLALALQHAHEFSHVIDYATRESEYLKLVNAICGSNLHWNDPDVQAVRSRHSKNPAQPFVDHAAAGGSSEYAAAIQPILGDIYDRWLRLITTS